MSGESIDLESDRAWLDGFRRGDRDALARVFRAYAPDVARALRRGVRLEVDGAPIRVGQDLPDHEIEVLVQETFLRVFAPKARASYDGIRPFGAWLAVIARNLVVDRARRRLNEAKHVVPVEDLSGFASEGTDPTWRLEEQAVARVVQTVRDGLQGLDLDVFRLRYEEKKTHKQAAHALGVSEIVVRRRDTKLRVLLLERLRIEGFLTTAKVAIGASLLGRKKREG